ncbi:MAG: hypothetical protein R8F63_00160 [Acidimicrobiales bacterium]|nr:hypothetical protein [Acidimicrobiales bacterium]
MERNFFEHVLDAFEGFVDDELGEPQATSHRRGLKVWFGDAEGRAAREHYEAQLIRVDGEAALEIGYHAEYPKEAENQAALDRLTGTGAWRKALGKDAEAGPFLGMEGWRRISEVWEPPDPDDPEAPIEIAARLADYVDAIEPVRRATLTT